MDRRNFLFGTAAVAATALFATESQAGHEAWVYLGRRKVNGFNDFDRIPVGRGEGRFRKIRLLVKGNDLFINDLDVRFGNGENQDIRVRSFIPQGGQTRAIDLAGGRRFIQNVRFHYGKPRNGRGATFVELWGRR